MHEDQASEEAKRQDVGNCSLVAYMQNEDILLDQAIEEERVQQAELAANLKGAVLANLQDDDMLLDQAIEEVRLQEAEVVAKLQAIVEGAQKAFRGCDDGQGNAPRCPWGHALEVAVVKAKACCLACRRKARRDCVAIRCSKGRCAFTSCARVEGCAPIMLVKVMNVLYLKYATESGQYEDWWEAG